MVLKFSYLSLVALITFVSTTTAKNAANIRDCPPLSTRTPPTNVNDLRIDDIKVIGALGDSVIAGFGLMGFDTSINYPDAMVLAQKEYRGLSYVIGGDSNAFTVANYIKHYQPNVVGASVGSHIVKFCGPDICDTSIAPEYGNKVNVLNAAISGAVAMELDYEIDYLIGTMQKLPAIDYENDWKMINIQIGGNDMCISCNSSYMDKVTPAKFGDYVEAAIEKIQASIPRVIINLIGTIDVSQVFNFSKRNIQYCIQRPDVNSCSCSSTSEGLAKMTQLHFEYNEKLNEIYKKYQIKQLQDFAVVYQPGEINLIDFPINFISNLDCFHPSLIGHRWFSKALWNQLFLPQAYKPKSSGFDNNQYIYCPVDSDRISTH